MLIAHVLKAIGSPLKKIYHINHSYINCVKVVTSFVSHNWDIYSTLNHRIVGNYGTGRPQKHRLA